MRLIFLIAIILWMHSITAFASSPFQLSIDVPKQSFLSCEPMMATVSLRNISKQTVFVPNGFTYCHCTFVLPSGKPGYEAGSYGMAYSTIQHYRPIMWPLQPGIAFHLRLNLIDHCIGIDQPGNYTIIAHYENNTLPDNQDPTIFTGELASQAITVRVTTPKGIDATVSKLLLSHATNSDNADMKGLSLYWIYEHNPEVCRLILNKYKSSTYAQYAMYYLHNYRELISKYPGCSLLPEAHLGVMHDLFASHMPNEARAEAALILRKFPDSAAAEEVHWLTDKVEPPNP